MDLIEQLGNKLMSLILDEPWESMLRVVLERWPWAVFWLATVFVGVCGWRFASPQASRVQQVGLVVLALCGAALVSIKAANTPLIEEAQPPTAQAPMTQTKLMACTTPSICPQQTLCSIFPQNPQCHD